jgi:hypothetical protein
VVPTAGWAAGSANVTAGWAGNRCRELLRLGLPERLELASFRGAGGFGDGVYGQQGVSQASRVYGASRWFWAIWE